MKKLLITLSALMIQFSLMAETWTLQGSTYTIEERVASTSLGAGTTYRVVRAYNSSRDMRIFYSVTDLTNPNVAVHTVAGGSKLTSRAAVGTMAGNITNATPLVGVNGGFFSSSAPGGLTVIDGNARKGFSGDGYYAISFDDNCVPSIGYLKQMTCWCSPFNGVEGWTDAVAINATSTDVSDAGVGEQIIFYTPEYGSTSESNSGGYAVQLTPVDGSKLTPGKYLKYKVTSAPSSGSVSIPSNGIVMFGKGTQNGKYVSGLSVGTEITVYMTLNLLDNTNNSTTHVANQALGGSLMILDNGNTITSYANSLGDISYAAPRTAVGYNADKTKLVMCVVDGRKSGWSDGCNGKILGDIMKTLGCSDALNFDGGGSSQFWTKSTGLLNDANANNMGGGIRSVADGLFVVELPTPVLSSTQSSLSFSTSDNAIVTKTFTVSGSSLRENISLALSGSNADQFKLSGTSISQDAASGAITVTYAPTTEGTHSAQITISSKAATSLTINLSGTNTITPEEPETPSGTFDDQNIVLTEGWNFSTNGTQPSYIDLTSNVVRAAAYQDGKLYILQNKAWATPVVTIVDAYTGEQKGTLDMTGIGSATIQLSDILAVDGKIIGCGCVTAAQTLKIYQWASDTATPTVLLEQVTGKIMGGSMSISGNLTNGRLWFTNDGTSEAYYYTVSNGAVNSTLNTISLMKANGTDAFAGGDGRGSAEVILNSDGSLWIDAKDVIPTLFTVLGTTATASKTMASVVNKFGTALKFFTFGTRSLAAAATYTSTSASIGGQLALLDVAAGIGNETAIETQPTAGLGSTDNTQRVSTVCAATDRNDGMSLDLWVAVNGQGVAYYYYDGKQEGSSSIEEIFTEEENVAPVEYYNLQGMKVANPQGGIFIKVQGNKVTKEYIR